MKMTRRIFMKAGAATVFCSGTISRFLIRTAFAVQRSNEGKILVAIFQRGAADGLNMVVPYAEPQYYAMRPSLGIQPPGRGSTESVIDLDGFFGLHPALAPFRPLYDGEQLAIIHAVGSPNSTRSHFDAQDFMESATPGSKSTPDGWLNRYLDAKAEGAASPFQAVAMGQRLPRSLMGIAPAIVLANINDFAIRDPAATGAAGDGFEAMYEQGGNDLLHGAGRVAFEAVKALRAADPTRYQPGNGAEYPRGPFGMALRQIAQLIKADIGLEIACTDSVGWDTHVAQGGAQGQMAGRLSEFSQAVWALHQDLGDRMRHVVILTMSEFGRTVRENGNHGTDHGHGNVMFLVGGQVRGGRVYGRWPGLEPDQLFERRDLAHTTDFRDVFGEILSRHLGARDLSRIFPQYAVDEARFLQTLRQ